VLKSLQAKQLEGCAVVAHDNTHSEVFGQLFSLYNPSSCLFNLKMILLRASNGFQL